MKILILGDSFAAHHEYKESWTRILAKKLDADVTVYAKGGQASYYCYHTLKHIREDYDFYIILITYAARIFVNPEIGITPGMAIRESDDISRAANDYYRFLYNEEYANDIQNWIIRAIRERLQDKKYLLMPCFEKAGLDTPFHLRQIQVYENSFLTNDSLNHLERKRFNHLFPENNIILADYFRDMILHGKSDITLKDFVPPPADITSSSF